MSQTYYQELWKETQNDLKKNLSFEAKVKKRGPYQDVNVAKWLIGHLFMNYVRIVNRLDECFDQMIHPQKREVIGRLLDLTLGRLLELKSEIVRIEMDNYCFFDDVLIELKLTHDDMEIQVPRYFWKDKEKIKEHRRWLMNRVFEEAEKEKFRMNYLKNVPEEAREEAWEQYLAREEQQRLEKEKLEEQQKKLMGGKAQVISSLDKLIREMNESESGKEDEELADAVLLIQRHERARRGRVQATWAKKYKMMKEEGLLAVRVPDEIGNKSATVIQKHWRRYRQRMRDRRRKEVLTELLGMAEPSHRDTRKLCRLEKVERLRRKLRERNQREYEEAFPVVKDQVAARYASEMEEYITEEIRNWFHWFFEQSGYLPDFPPEKPIVPTGEILGVPKALGPTFAEKTFPQASAKKDAPVPSSGLAIALAGLSAIGGSALVVAGHWIGPHEYSICQKELEKMKKAGKGERKKKEMSKEEKMELKKKLKEQEKKMRLAEEALGFKLKESNYVNPLKKADKDYRVTWLDVDESKNYEQRYIYGMLKDEKCWELSMEVRTIVDEVMRLELEILKEAREKDLNPKKKKKKKKPKAKKEKKKKEKKDPTGHRSLDDLFMELFRNGIIRDYEEVHLKDYVGERSYCAFEFRQRLMDWPPSTGDVKELILQMCILPLGSSRIHQLSPLIKSVCLMGPENSGKEFLARIICTETASVMFDLTPSNVVGKYPGKSGLKMLQHLVEKMSRALQPSVIFVDGAEKTFYKKVPKEEKHLDPKRMAGLVQKVVKGIKPADQVLLVGVCSQPWLAKRNKLLKNFQKLIYVPQMDYASYVRIWQALLTPYHSVSRNFDISCLARVSTGFSVKAIMDAVRNVFTIQRISRSLVEPYKPIEFLEELLKTKAADEKSTEKCVKFYAGTELPRKRAKRLNQIRQEIEKAKKKA